jgi:hypothetical protein
MVRAGGLAKKLLLAVNALVVVVVANSTKKELARDDEGNIIMVGDLNVLASGSTRHYYPLSL